MLIAGRVYSFGGESSLGFLPRPDIRPALEMLSPDFISDGEHIYLRDGQMAEGFHAKGFRPLKSTCPVPGNPELRCVPDGPYVRDNVQVHAGVGDGGLVFDTGPAPYSVADVDPNEVVYFKVQLPHGGSCYLAISNHHLYLLQSSSRGHYPYQGRPLSGPLRGPDADGYMSDDNGRFLISSGTSTPSSWYSSE